VVRPRPATSVGDHDSLVVEHPAAEGADHRDPAVVADDVVDRRRRSLVTELAVGDGALVGRVFVEALVREVVDDAGARGGCDRGDTHEQAREIGAVFGIDAADAADELLGRRVEEVVVAVDAARTPQQVEVLLSERVEPLLRQNRRAIGGHDERERGRLRRLRHDDGGHRLGRLRLDHGLFFGSAGRERDDERDDGRAGEQAVREHGAPLGGECRESSSQRSRNRRVSGPAGGRGRVRCAIDTQVPCAIRQWSRRRGAPRLAGCSNCITSPPSSNGTGCTAAASHLENLSSTICGALSASTRAWEP